MGCRVPTLAPGSIASTPHTPTVSRGIPALSPGSSRVAPRKVAIRQRIARSGASLVRLRTTSRNVGPNRRVPQALVAVLPPSAIWRHRSGVLKSGRGRPPVPRVSPGDLRDPPWSHQHRLADANSQGRRESRGAQPPRGAFAFAPELSNELSVRGDKNNAMHCRKKPRDALAVRTSSCSDVNTHSPLSRRGDRVGRKPATGSQS